MSILRRLGIALGRSVAMELATVDQARKLEHLRRVRTAILRTRPSR